MMLPGIFAGILLVGVVADMLGLLQKEDESATSTPELFNLRLSMLDRPTLLRLIARRIDENGEVNDLDSREYVRAQVQGCPGLLNSSLQELREIYLKKVDVDGDVSDAMDLFDDDLEHLASHPEEYVEYLSK